MALHNKLNIKIGLVILLGVVLAVTGQWLYCLICVIIVILNLIGLSFKK